MENNFFFPGQGKVREFFRWAGKFGNHLKRQEKIKKFVNYFRKCTYSVQGEKIYFLVQAHWGLLLKEKNWGLLLRERICSLGEQILSCKRNLNFSNDTVSTV